MSNIESQGSNYKSLQHSTLPISAHPINNNGNSSLVRRVICPKSMGIGLGLWIGLGLGLGFELGLGLWLGLGMGLWLGLASNLGLCTTTFRTNDRSDK